MLASSRCNVTPTLPAVRGYPLDLSSYASSEGALWGATTLMFVRTLAVGDTMTLQVFHSGAGAIPLASRLEIAQV